MTIISQSNYFIFIHIRKCGGTSLEKAYENQMSWNDLILGSTATGELIQPYYLTKFNLHKHSSSLEIRKIIGTDYWDKQFSFALVRHPRSIHESFYKWACTILFYKSGGRQETLEKWKNDCKENIFEHDFLGWGPVRGALLADDFNEYIFETVGKNYIQDTCFSFISDEYGHPLVKKYYKLENIGQMWAELSEKLDRNITPLRENVSRPKNLTWSAESKRLVDEKHQIDYEFFKYRPEIFPE